MKKRVAQQYSTKRPDGKVPYSIVFGEPAVHFDGDYFKDHAIHRCLTKRNFPSVGGEWFRCTVDELRAAYIAVRDGVENVENRNRHASEPVGGFDTVITREEYDRLAGTQQASMVGV